MATFEVMRSGSERDRAEGIFEKVNDFVGNRPYTYEVYLRNMNTSNNKNL